MRRGIVIIIGLWALVLLPLSAAGDWSVGDDYKMHFPQLPDPNGWDVAVWTDPGPPIHGVQVADDWLCTETGNVSDIHLWFSMKGGLTPDDAEPGAIRFTIYSNDLSDPFSKPGGLLWQRVIDPDSPVLAGPWDGDQGWLDPSTGEVVEHDHDTYWQLNLEDITDPFIQEAGNIYWLGLELEMYDAQGLPFTGVGWKTSLDHFEDDAVWAELAPDPAAPRVWNELFDPITGVSLDLAFVITSDTIIPEPATLALLGLAACGLGAYVRRRRKAP